MAARVAAPRDMEEPGIVRRYVLSHQPVVRDLASNLKLHLDHVLEGNLDEFVLPRVLGNVDVTEE